MLYPKSSQGFGKDSKLYKSSGEQKKKNGSHGI
jgi:hypothetical protein